MYSWIKTHQEISEYLSKNKEKQPELIKILKDAGIVNCFRDYNPKGKEIGLSEIDPFTFMSCIYKHGDQRKLEILQKVSAALNLTQPTDVAGVASTNGMMTWLFPYKYERTHNEIARLWDFFFSVLNDTVTEEKFDDILTINSVWKATITESLYRIFPEKYFPLNNRTIFYLKKEFNISSDFETYAEYLNILKQIREKTVKHFYEISHTAIMESDVNYWIFQGNPEVYDVENALISDTLVDWTVTAHKEKIKIGDKVILWVTGKNPGCYALAEVTAEPYEITEEIPDANWKIKEKNTVKAGITITHNLVRNPISKGKITDNAKLKNLKVGNQGSNFSATKVEYMTLLGMIQAKKYWLYAPGENANMWEEFHKKGIIALGWDELDDLSKYESKKAITEKLQELGWTTKSKQNDATANYEFQNWISIGDIIIVKKGRGELLGYGEVTSDAFYDDTRENYKNCRKVEWKKKGNWKTDHNLVIKTLTDISIYPTDSPGYQFYYEKLLAIMNDTSTLTNSIMNYPLNTIFYGPPGTGKTYTTLIRAAEIIEKRTIANYGEAQQIFNQHLGDRIEFITFHQNYSYEDFIQGLRPDVENEGNLSFERKDGVFKRIADRALRNLELSEKSSEDISEEIRFDKALQSLTDEIQDSEDAHPLNKSVNIIWVDGDAFRYAFKEGNQNTNGLRMKFSDLKEMHRNHVKERQDIKKLTSISGLASQHASYFLMVYNKILKHLPTKEAAVSPVQKQNYVIIIDEINRANISRVFGELITLIEKDKRSHGSIPLRCTLPSGESFIVPSNLYIIGTMNTADKSIALLDIALRRRFEFEAMYPKYEIEWQEIYDVEIFQKINNKIKELKGHDFQIGQAYFMGENSDLVERMNKKVIPLLLEYFMNDEKEVRGILSNAGLTIEENSWPLKITR